ncbi:MAG: carboxymuconolactone decarboxylase family protein [Chloroflexia bacterium]|nr:carboxymuconolactone decarboxylase family protein [Chloroflexia bacterium]
MASRITDDNVLREKLHQPMFRLSTALQNSSVEGHLRNLVTMRVSQINGCAFCLAMHARDLREAGEREDRIYLLDAWRETDWFTDRERAALAWAEAMTTLPNREIADELFEKARAQFSETELADLTLVVIAINGWNRINIAFHTPPQPFTIETRKAVAAL